MNHFLEVGLLKLKKLILSNAINKLQKPRSLILIEVPFTNLYMNVKLHTWKVCSSNNSMKNSSSSDNNRILFKSFVTTSTLTKLLPIQDMINLMKGSEIWKGNVTT